MRSVITTEKIPIKLWLDDMEPGALEQARNLANHPLLCGHVAIMPDAHQGFGMPIGGVMTTREAVIPNAVGVDIGCGMCAVRTSLPTLSLEHLKRVLTEIRRTIPLGFAHHKKKQDARLMPGMEVTADDLPVVFHEYEAALTQLGTLGGGNHFIEIQKGDDGFLWLMIHSGSRNLGYKVAGHYNRLAEEWNRQSGLTIPVAWQLASLPLASDAGALYLQEMHYCVDFAFANRMLMMERVKEALLTVAVKVRFEPVINIAHNYAALEQHFGREVLVHRKGATSAREGEVGIIPGSQGSCSYIVRGRGNPESFTSSSHGAGRKMGRRQAQRQLDLAHEKKRLDDLGIIHSVRSVSDLEEAPGAYKDIDIVMANQADLVEVLLTLHPLAVVKG